MLAGETHNCLLPVLLMPFRPVSAADKAAKLLRWCRHLHQGTQHPSLSPLRVSMASFAVSMLLMAPPHSRLLLCSPDCKLPRGNAFITSVGSPCLLPCELFERLGWLYRYSSPGSHAGPTCSHQRVMFPAWYPNICASTRTGGSVNNPVARCSPNRRAAVEWTRVVQEACMYCTQWYAQH